MDTKPQAIALDAEDNVAALLQDAAASAAVSYRSGLATGEVALKEAIKFGHKVALRPIRRGEKVVKYGKPIGYATQDILPGEHVHIHNVRGLRC
jgi:altronate dehydratase small subunit